MTTPPPRPPQEQRFSTLTPQAVENATVSGVEPVTPVDEPAPDDTAPIEPTAPPVELPEPGTEPEVPADAPPVEPLPLVDPFAPPPAPTPADAPETIDFFGASLSRDEGLALASLYQWATSLTPEQLEAVNGAIAGAPAPGTPAPGITPPPAAPEDDEFTDPALTELRAQVAALTQQTAVQQQLAAQQAIAAQHKPHADRAVADFATSNQLSEPDMDLIRQKLFAHPYILENMHAQTQGDTYRTYMGAFETVAWTDPTLRERLIAARAVADHTQQDEIAAKRARASALSGSGGSVSRDPSAPTTKQQRRDAMIADIRAQTAAGN